MAFGSGTSLGNGGSSTANQTSIVATLAVQANAGTFVWIAFAVDNFATTTGDEGAISGVVDSAGGNTWEKAVEFCNPSASPAAQAGATVSIWYCRALVNAIPNGGTITATLTNTASRDASAWTARSHTKGSQTRVVVEKTGTLANNAADPGSLNATTINVECLRIRAIASETNSTTALTATSTWTEQTGNRSGSGSATANQTIRAEFLISTATGAASDPTYISADHASAYVAFREEPIIAAAMGSFSLNGQIVNTKRHYPLAAALGSFSLSGQVVDYRLIIYGPAPSDYVGVAVSPVASYAVGGIQLVDPTEVGGGSMEVGLGTFNLLGQEVPLVPPGGFVAPDHLGVADAAVASYSVAGVRLVDPTATMAVGLGTFTLIGFPSGRKLEIATDYGLFSLAGQAVGLRKNYVASADLGTFALAGAVVTKRQTITAAFGNFALSGQQVGLKTWHIASAGLGSFSLAGQPVVLTPPGLRLAAFYGTFQLTGQVVGSRRTFAAGLGTFQLGGQAVGLKRAWTATAGLGSFSLAGQVVGLNPVQVAPDHLSVADAAVASFPVGGSNLVDPVYAPSIAVEVGVYTLLGSAATIVRSLAVGLGSFSLNGQPVALDAGEARLAAEVGIFQLTGQRVGPDVDVPLGVAVAAVAAFPVGGERLVLPLGGVQFLMPVGAGVFSLLGQTIRRNYAMPVGLGTYNLIGTASFADRVLRIGVGSFALAGQQVQFIPAPGGHPMPVGLGTYQLSGKVVTLQPVRKLIASAGMFILAGQQVSKRTTVAVGYGSFGLQGKAVTKRQTFAAARGLFNLAGQQVNLKAAKRLAVGLGTFQLAGQAVTRPGQIAAARGLFQLSGKAVTLAEKHRMPVELGTFQLAGQTVAIGRRIKITAQFGNYTLAGQLVGLWRHKKVTASFGAFALLGQQARLFRTYQKLAVGHGVFNLAGQAVGATLGQRALTAQRGIFTLAGKDVYLLPNLISDTMPVQPGVFQLLGQPVALKRPTLTLPIVVGVYNLNGTSVTLYARGSREPTEPRTGGAVTSTARRTTASTGNRHGTQADNITRRRAS